MACSRRLADISWAAPNFTSTDLPKHGQQGHRNKGVMGVNKLLLALGANLPAAWGSPRQTLQRAERELWRAGLRTLTVSHVYDTLPLGPGRQAPYVNAVLLLQRGCFARSPAAPRQENRAAGRPQAWCALGTALPRHRYPRLRRQADWLAQAPTSARQPAAAPAWASRPATPGNAQTRVRAGAAARGRPALAPSSADRHGTHASGTPSPCRKARHPPIS